MPRTTARQTTYWKKGKSTPRARSISALNENMRQPAGDSHVLPPRPAQTHARDAHCFVDVCAKCTASTSRRNNNNNNNCMQLIHQDALNNSMKFNNTTAELCQSHTLACKSNSNAQMSTARQPLQRAHHAPTPACPRRTRGRPARPQTRPAGTSASMGSAARTRGTSPTTRSAAGARSAARRTRHDCGSLRRAPCLRRHRRPQHPPHLVAVQP